MPPLRRLKQQGAQGAGQGLRQIKTLAREVAAPKGNEVQLEIKAVGICGSDLAYWQSGIAGGFVKLDFSERGLCSGYCGQMGHEAAGVVVALGASVDRSKLAVGDRVALEPGMPCRSCSFCLSGRYNLCKEIKFIGSAVNKTPGALCTVFNHDASFVYKIPRNMSLQEAAMLEPLCVALHATRRAKVRMGDHVLITGAGPIGLLTALAVKAAGVTSVSITDLNPIRLAKAKAIGVDYQYNSADTDLATAMLAADGGAAAFDVCFECCGVLSALDLCIQTAKSGGAVCAVANMKDERVPCLLQEAARREVDIIGVYRYCNLYPTAVDMVSSGKIDLKKLLSERSFSLDEANDAFEFFATGSAVKVIISPGT